MAVVGKFGTLENLNPPVSSPGLTLPKKESPQQSFESHEGIGLFLTPMSLEPFQIEGAVLHPDWSLLRGEMN
jgi:hypothetical protein